MTKLFIDSAAIRHNYALLKSRLNPGGTLIPMIKANGCGAGMANMVSVLGDQVYGVASVSEAVELRQMGHRGDIFLCHCLPEEAEAIQGYDLEVGVDHPELIDALASAGKAIKVHLQIDTGMGRFGCLDSDTEALMTQIRSKPSLELAGVMSHLACAENPDFDLFTQEQIQRFEKATKGLSVPKHLCNSAGLLRFDPLPFQAARPGLSLLGIHPSGSGATSDLKPALRLVSRLEKINTLEKGQSAGYGRSFVAQRKSRIGVIPIGYADGWLRQYSGKGSVKIRGGRAPCIGNVCMNHLLVDLSDLPECEVGDEVEFFGPNYPVERAAEEVGTIGHAMIACLRVTGFLE